MKPHSIDTNIVIRFLVEDPKRIPARFKGVYSFFRRIERAEVIAELHALVVFEAFFVLTSCYEIPASEAARRLHLITSLKGMRMHEKPVVLRCLEILETDGVDLVDAYILAHAEIRGLDAVYSFDRDLFKRGLRVLPVE